MSTRSPRFSRATTTGDLGDGPVVTNLAKGVRELAMANTSAAAGSTSPAPSPISSSTRGPSAVTRPILVREPPPSKPAGRAASGAAPEHVFRRELSAPVAIPAGRPSVSGLRTTHIEFSPDLFAALKACKSGRYVVIRIADDQSAIDLDRTGQCGGAVRDVQEIIERAVARYYLINSKRPVFIYACPDGSPRKDRMLYSTTKGHVMDTLTDMGFRLDVRLEISEAADITDETLGMVAPRPASKEGPAIALPKAKVVVPSQAEGSLSAFMAQSLGKNPQGIRKKVVMPPPGAY